MMTVPALAPLSDLGDEALAFRFQSGDTRALEELFRRYGSFARAKLRTYFVIGADADDVEQEGLIGLFKAARDYRGDRQSSFRTFAELCVTRQVVTAIKTATRHKHRPLNHYVALSGASVSDAGSETGLEEQLDGLRSGDPADEVISRERIDVIRRSMDQDLSVLEAEVLRLYVDGKSYDEIALRLGRQAKSIDNALQRIKRKIGNHLGSAERDGPPGLVA